MDIDEIAKSKTSYLEITEKFGAFLANSTDILINQIEKNDPRGAYFLISVVAYFNLERTNKNMRH